jgi:hypothetical protein
MGMPQVQAPMPMVPRQYGGEVGTGGLVEVLDDGTQVFSNTEEGILNRSLHGGIMQGQTQTASAPSGFSGGPTASGTLASGTSAPSNFTISTGQDKYGNTIGDLTGTQDYYDLNFAARDAGQDTFMYGDKLMQVDPGYLRGGGINPFISNRLPEGLQQQMIDRPDLFTPGSFDPFGNPNLSSIQKIQGDPTDLSFYKEAPYLPTEDFTRDISGQYDSYYEANKAALEAGSPTFMYGSKLAKTDPGLLPDYVGAPKPFISNAVPEKFISAGLYLPPGWSNMSAQALADAQPGKKQYVGYGLYAKHGGPVISKQYGGEVGTGGLVGLTDDGTQIFERTQTGILNRALHGGILQGQNVPTASPTTTTQAELPQPMSMSEVAPQVLPKDLSGVDNVALSPLLSMPSVQDRGGVYNASEIRDAGIDLNRPSDAPETVISSSGSQTKYRDPNTGQIPYDLYVAPSINTFGQGYDLKDMDYFTANALALSEGADRFMYNDEYAAVDPGLLSNYNYSELGTKPYADPVGPIQGVSYAGTDAGKIGNYNLPQNPNSPAAMRAKGYKYPGYGLPPVYVGFKHGGLVDLPVVKRQTGNQVFTLPSSPALPEGVDLETLQKLPVSMQQQILTGNLYNIYQAQMQQDEARKALAEQDIAAETARVAEDREARKSAAIGNMLGSFARGMKTRAGQGFGQEILGGLEGAAETSTEISEKDRAAIDAAETKLRADKKAAAKEWDKGNRDRALELLTIANTNYSLKLDELKAGRTAMSRKQAAITTLIDLRKDFETPQFTEMAKLFVESGDITEDEIKRLFDPEFKGAGDDTNSTVVIDNEETELDSDKFKVDDIQIFSGNTTR